MRHPEFLKSPVRIRRKAAAFAVLGLAAIMLSACETDGSNSSPLASLTGPAKTAEPPMTRSRAASECWMATEKGRADADLDKRADFVTKCIDQKMKTAGDPPKT